jgi:DNA processing protein
MQGPFPTPREQLIALATVHDAPRGDVVRAQRRILGREPTRESTHEPTAPRDDASSPVDVALKAAAAVAARQERSAASWNAKIVTVLDDDYPGCLRVLDDSPPVLFLRGTWPEAEGVAIVGSRKPDAYGLEVAELFAREFARRGLTVVSGFARGIDAAAHRAALAAGAPTLAFLGCGLDIDYPRGHRALAADIEARGAVVTEFGFGRIPDRWHFPVRNRSIAAAARATLVVQAALASGSLSTAHQALELGREVFAVPGRIVDELSQGTNGLLRDGAGLAQHPDDVLEALGLATGTDGMPRAPLGAPARRERASARANAPAGPGETPVSPPTLPEGLDADARAILGRLADGAAATVEDLGSATAIAAERLLATLLELELRGLVTRRPGPSYAAALW